MNLNLIDILERLNRLEARMTTLEQVETSSEKKTEVIPQKKLSLREFLLSRNPGNDVKKTLAIGYFLEIFEGFKSFNVSDLETAFERAKEKKPSNLNDKVNMNIRNGFMEEASERKNNRKAWYLTNSGEEFINSRLNSKSGI